MQNYYSGKVSEAERGKDRVTLDFKQISIYNLKLADKIIDSPEEVLKEGELALENLTDRNPVLRIKNIPKSTHREIRKLRHTDIHKLITIEGTISAATTVNPVITQTMHECPSCGAVVKVKQEENYIKEPKACSCGRKGKFRELTNQRTQIDKQIIIMEENIEQLDITDQPKRIDVTLTQGLCNYELTKHHTPGNKLRINGILTEIPKKTTKGQSTDRKYILIANHIEPTEIGYEEIKITPQDEKNIIELSKKENIIELLTENYAPNIYGYDYEKLILILSIIGGNTQKNKKGRITKRGHIHTFLIGDPGTSKTQLVKTAWDFAPKVRYASGATSTAAGLIASVKKDEIIGDYTLYAGAMVMATKGICIIDELDKAQKDDLGALHEAMSEGSVTVNKATIRTTLPCETTLLAAANPKYGKFDPGLHISQQIELPPALINRFDYILTFKDKPNTEQDAKIFRKIANAYEEGEIKATNHIEPQLIKKYMSYAKKIKPELTPEALETLEKHYTTIRNTGSQHQNTIPINARNAEAIIRTSQAIAKLKLKNKIDVEDAELATKLIIKNLKQIAIDPETGLLDIDYFTTGQGSNTRNARIELQKTIKELSNTNPTGNANIDEVIKITVEKTGKSEFEIEEMLDKMRNDGDTASLKPGTVRLI